MKRFPMALCATAVLLASPAARGQTTEAPTVYTAVDAVALQYNRLTITGVVQGAAAASKRTFIINPSNTRDVVDAATLQTCVHLASIAMEKPGAYLFQVAPTGVYLNSNNYGGCTLSRVTP